MSSIKNQKIGGDASVGRNVAMGGNGRIAGSLIIGHNLQVKGWLEAPNIKDTNKGVFASAENLNAAYPSPRDGWFAGVGESTPFDLYVAEGGAWVATGGELNVEVDLDYYNGVIERIDGDIHDLTDDVSANSDAIEQHDGLIAGHTQQIAEITETLTEVQQTATEAKEQSEANADNISEHGQQIAGLSSTVNAHSQSIAGHGQQIEQISEILTETRGTADEAKYQSNANAVNIGRVNALVGYYECSTPSSVSAKTISANNFSRIVGGCMHVKMHFTNTASSVTLNINGTGAIALYYNGKHVSARNTWEDDEIVVVFFDGDEYQAFPVGAKYIEQQSQPQPSQPEDFPELDELEERVGSLERAAGQHNVLPFDGTLSFPSVTPSDTLYEHTIQPREAFEYSICLISVLGSVRFCLKVGNNYYNNWSIKKQFSSDGLIPVGQGSIDDPYSVPSGTYTEEISNNDWYSGELHNKVFYNRSNKVVYAYNCETKSLEAMTNIQVVEENAPEAESTSNPNNSTKGSIVVDLEHDKLLTWDGNKWKELSGGGSVDIADLPNTLAIENGVLYLKNVKDGISTVISQANLPVPEDGENGQDGKSAYELAKQENPNVGTLQDWLASLKGVDGFNGKSAYEVWRDWTDEYGSQPNKDKTEKEFLASLKDSDYKMQAVTARPSTIAEIEADKIYLYPDGSGQFSTAIYTGDLESSYDSTKWVVLATNPGDLSGAFTDISGLRADVNNLKDIQKNIGDIEDELFQKSELVPSSSIYASTDLFDGSVFTFYGFTISTQLQLKEIRTITATQRGASDCIILFVADKETGTIKSKHRIEFDSTEIRTIDVSNLNIVLGEGDTFAYASGVSPINTQNGICNTVIRRLADVDGGITYYARQNAGDRNLDVGGVLPNVGGQYVRQFTGYPPFEMYFEGESLSEKVDALSDAVNANEQNISEIADEVGAKETVIPYWNGSGNPRLKVFEFFGLNISENQQVKRIVTPTSVTGSFILFTLNEDTTLIKTKNVIVFDNATEVDVSNLDIILEAGDTIAYSTTAETENKNDFFQKIGIKSDGFTIHIINESGAREKSVGETMGRNLSWVMTGYPTFGLVMESSSLGEKVTELERQVSQNTAAIEMGGSAATANKTLAVLGDSITWFQISTTPLRGWLTYFKEQILFKGVRNYALSGATWTNTANTQDSDSTSMNSSSDDNVIYNQVRRLIADVNNGADAPDYIMILAGINDAYFRGQNALHDDFSASDWGSVGGTTRYIGSRSITTCTSVYKAMRYVAEMIWEEFPFAQVIVTTPLRSTQHTSDRKTVSELIKKSAYEFGWTCIDQDEVNVSILKETLVASEGKMLASDGLHPTVDGAKIIGRWLASKFKANMA